MHVSQVQALTVNLQVYSGFNINNPNKYEHQLEHHGFRLWAQIFPQLFCIM